MCCSTTVLAVLAFARQATLAFLGDIPEDKLCYSPVPDGNHALWLIGHLTRTDDSVQSKLGGTPARCPAGWDKLFGMGSKPSPRASDYPPFAELKQQFAARRDDLIAGFKAMDAVKLVEPLPADYLRLAPNYAGFMAWLAWHEGMHAGQLRLIGKGLGKPPKFG